MRDGRFGIEAGRLCPQAPAASSGLTAFRTARTALHRIGLARAARAADTAFIASKKEHPMNTAATRLTHAVMIVAALAAIVIAAPVQSAPASGVVVMPQVTVTAKRANFAPAAVVRMPTVTVTSRRVERADSLQAGRVETRAARVAACDDPMTTARC
jgi:hypothetical protein